MLATPIAGVVSNSSNPLIVPTKIKENTVKNTTEHILFISTKTIFIKSHVFHKAIQNRFFGSVQIAMPVVFWWAGAWTVDFPTQIDQCNRSGAHASSTQAVEITRENSTRWLRREALFQLQMLAQTETLGRTDYCQPLVCDGRTFKGNVTDSWASVRKKPAGRFP